MIRWHAGWREITDIRVVANAVIIDVVVALFTDSRSHSVAVLDLVADTVREVLPEGVDATYLDTGHILYAHPNGGLFAAPFDLNGLEVTGQSRPVVDDVLLPNVTTFTPRAAYSVSRDGMLVYGMGAGCET